jgi:hypothetical protein
MKLLLDARANKDEKSKVRAHAFDMCEYMPVTKLPKAGGLLLLLSSVITNSNYFSLVIH